MQENLQAAGAPLPWGDTAPRHVPWLVERGLAALPTQEIHPALGLSGFQLRPFEPRFIRR